jgi:hypothetical protein
MRQYETPSWVSVGLVIAARCPEPRTSLPSPRRAHHQTPENERGEGIALPSIENLVAGR